VRLQIHTDNSKTILIFQPNKCTTYSFTTPKYCRNCGIDISGKKYAKTFCSTSCSNSFHNKHRTLSPETKEKIRQSLLGRRLTKPEKTSRGFKHAKAVGAYTKGRYHKYPPESILALSMRTVRKILKRMELPCSRCGWNEAVCDLHHIWGKKIADANSHMNLTYLCPNCHMLFHSKKIGPEDVINLEEYIGNSWKGFYFG
jgi:hypothetical protein